MARSLVLISGYYGFDNLGDEAILEQLVSEVKAASINPKDIVVLSNNPQLTSQQFAVDSVNRWSLKDIVALLPRTRLFISGGGGLFQDTHSLKSIIYYGGLIALARLLGSKILIYAQGLGPLNKPISQSLTKQFLQLADKICVRDDKSFKMLEQWGLKTKSIRTADPVWALQPSTPPQAVSEQITVPPASKGKPSLIGISLRTGAGFSQSHLRKLVETLQSSLDQSATLVMLPLQDEQDRPILSSFADLWHGKNQIIWLAPETKLLPSQWLALIASLDMVIGMRLHSLIMSLANGKPVVGISYDAKVEIILNQFAQPNLKFNPNQENEDHEGNKDWIATIESALTNYSQLSSLANVEARNCREAACQNGALIAKILA
jgi:polysaccharide pyruvyl transferase CsaB